jgi:hypothetical protein
MQRQLVAHVHPAYLSQISIVITFKISCLEIRQG